MTSDERKHRIVREPEDIKYIDIAEGDCCYNHLSEGISRSSHYHKLDKTILFFMLFT